MADGDRLQLAREQLNRVQVAALEPEDWSDIATYGLYALENATVALAESLNLSWKRNHWEKASLAETLHRDHGVPDVGSLMRDLNGVRKSEAYGEVAVSIEWSSEDVATVIEQYLDDVERVIGGSR